MKTIISLAVALLTAAMLFAASAAEKAVVIVTKDGQQLETVISSLNRINIGSDAIEVVTDRGATSHAIADIDRINIQDASMSAVADILGEGEIAVWPTVVETAVNVTGLPDGAKVTVYDLSGKTVAAATAADGVTTAIDLSGAASGIYLVNTGNGAAVKIVKK